MNLLKEYLTYENIQKVLGIKDKPLNRLLSSLITHNGLYNRDEVIILCMGGCKVTEEEVKELNESNGNI